MRPLPGDHAPGRPRTSDPDGPNLGLPPAPQMTYFLADESAIGSPSQPPPVPLRRPKDSRRVPFSESPEHKSRGRSHHDLDRDREHRGRPSTSTGPPGSLAAFRRDESNFSRTVSPFPTPSDTADLEPLTPVLLGASGSASILSSVSSRRNSLCLSEDLDSRPLSMRDGETEQGGEYGEDTEPRPCGPSMMDSGSAPQLIMPSIKMPSRRPFTNEGKHMGRLKVLIAGDSGVGKTSLIKAIVQSCEHIVHVDPITPSSLLASSMARSVPLTIGGAGSKRRQPSRERTRTSEITEVYASTKPYPEWWSDADDYRILKRRKSLGDAVLDRNICFVDTPGYGSGLSVRLPSTCGVLWARANFCSRWTR